jgi:AcrR family transcriptional regulator
VDATQRTPLTPDLVLTAAIRLADHEGAGALSMRRLARELGVVPMALYKHFPHKEALLSSMVDIVIAEVAPPTEHPDWRVVLRRRTLSARTALLRHPWASEAIQAQQMPSMAVLAYFDTTIRILRSGALSIDLVHHSLHALGSRIFGFSQEVFNDQSDGDPTQEAEMWEQLAPTFPAIFELFQAATHQDDTIVGSGCDDQFEFEFALDLLLDGIETKRIAEATARRPQ